MKPCPHSWIRQAVKITEASHLGPVSQGPLVSSPWVGIGPHHLDTGCARLQGKGCPWGAQGRL